MRSSEKRGITLCFTVLSLILAASCSRDPVEKIRKARRNYDVQIVSSAPNYEAKLLLVEISIKNHNQKGKGLAYLTTVLTLYDERGNVLVSERATLDVSRIGPNLSAVEIVHISLPEREVKAVSIEIEKDLSDTEILLLKDSSRT